jgi:hypothetical protein
MNNTLCYARVSTMNREGSSQLVMPIDAASARALGWLPALSLVAALGVLVIALADNSARVNAPLAEPLFWIGLLVLFVPIAARLSMPGLTRQESIGLVVILGLGLYLVKVLYSPLGFTLFDEFLHWRTANDIAQSGHLFRQNPMLPVSPLYPGLENVTNALMSLSGLTIFQVGVIVVGVARLVTVLALYLFYEEIGQSSRLAGIGTALYMANPNFLFFDSQFAYESLALPLMLLVLFALVRWQQERSVHRVGFSLVAALGVLAVVVTHHVTAYIATALLILWAAIGYAYNKWLRSDQPSLGWIALWAVAANLAWLLGVSSATIGYLAPHLSDSVRALVGLIAGEGTGRVLFQSSTGGATLLERVTGLASVALTVLGLPFGLLQWWQRHRNNAASVWLVLGAIAYPATLALRLTDASWEIAARSASFLFIGVAYVLALGVERLRLSEGRLWLTRLAFAMCAMILFAGGVIAGRSPWSRLPWPYAVGAESRSIEPEGIAAAKWALTFLGPDNRVAADRTNTSLMGSYGEQRVITDLVDKVSISGVFLSPQLGSSELAVLRQARIRYLVVDRRFSRALPLSGQYYEKWERLIVPYTTPIELTTLDKFARIRDVNQVFDSGDIAIYDVGALDRGP